ncbi:serine hydrolase [Gelidibacter salicanalis]|uniref:Serine hydrolase n=1 Tax=Gelidibacter salicanalis TaxID=291193 RepID=A0A934KZD7_9FLAO|nr:serine hydrolase [Gelidibacter salicanalis]MBJ7882295.1 serine hydrolase [Gelidibacter salicanalis]
MKYVTLLGILLMMGCASVSPIKKAITSDDAKLNTVMTHLPIHEVQILFSEVVRDKDGKVKFKEDKFQVDDDHYFYPASTVKLPIVLLALEKLNRNKLLNIHTPFKVENDWVTSTFAKDIIAIFAVSSNAAFNRLFEYLGQDEINQQLKDKGINAKIYHRLSIPNSDNLTTTPVLFYKNDSVIYKTETKANQPMAPLQLNSISKGIGYTIGDSLVHQPMHFSKKNYLPIRSLHGILKRLMYPEFFPKAQQFDLTAEDRQFLIDNHGSASQGSWLQPRGFSGYLC